MIFFPYLWRRNSCAARYARFSMLIFFPFERLDYAGLFFPRIARLNLRKAHLWAVKRRNLS